MHSPLHIGRKNLSMLARPCMVVLLAFTAVGLLATLAINLSFLSPVSQIVKSFSFSDIYYNVLTESAQPDTSRVITIVDITDLPDRREIADVLVKVADMKPKVMGVDIIFEGRKPDSLSDNRLTTIAQGDSNIVFSYRLSDYANDSVGYRNDVHSFFREVIPINEGFTNFERQFYGGIKRKTSLELRCRGEERTSFAGNIATLFSDGKLTRRREKELNINFTPTVFRIIHPDSINHNRELIEGHVVLIGAVNELADTHYTPLGQIAGVELQAYAIQTLLEHSEVRHLNIWITALLSFVLVLITYFYRKGYINWAKSRKPQMLGFFLSSTFAVGIVLFIWTAILVGFTFLLFCSTGISVDLGWALAAIPFLGGAYEFFGITIRNFST